MVEICVSPIMILAGLNYEIDRTFGNLILFGGTVLFIMLMFLMVNNRKQKRMGQTAEQKNQELEAKYAEMETAYVESLAEKDSLTQKYEDLKRSEENSRRIAYLDNLTDLPNRTAFIEKLDHIMQTLRKGDVAAIMFIDLDNFKDVNDTLGHSYGDELLIDVADRLKQVIDENDYLARVGGDEFIILSQNMQDVSDCDEKIKKVQTVFSYPFVLAMKEYFITLSIGICFAPKDGKTSQILMKNVDAAMYAAKNMGKNTHYYYDESISKKLMEKIELQAELRNGIDKGEFVVYYQPQMDLLTGRVAGYEAFVRWNHPTRGILAPENFISVSEETGLIIMIGQWVIMEACRQLRKWESEGKESVYVSVNLSSREFKDASLISSVTDAINETGIKPNQLKFEIKESIALEDVVFAIEVIENFKQLGILFAIDNFGTDYSSISYLKLLPVSCLKMDKSLIATAMDSESEQKLIAALIELAHALELEVVFEGIENERQAEFLKSTHCNKAQGYYYSAPSTAIETE